MKFGIREVCDCAFVSLDGKGPNFTIDTATMSTIESASTTVYAQGGKGYARLAAWEGEKTLTFTVESAILTTESLAALTGSAITDGKLSIKSHNFAGYYAISAHTLVRETEDGEDKVALITIPKAKLQSNFSMAMAPTGDPSSFTFTFDAFPDNNNTLCDIAIDTDEDIVVATNAEYTAVLFDLDGKIFTTSAAAQITTATGASWTEVGNTTNTKPNTAGTEVVSTSGNTTTIFIKK